MSINSGNRSGSLYGDEQLINLLPNLPGYRPKKQPTGFKKSHFEFVEGSSFLKDDATPSYVPSLGGLNDEESTLSIGALKKKTAVQDFGVVLTYNAFFEEKPDSLQAGQRQIRKVRIFYYLEDDTIKIVEKPEINSGTTQGTQVGRGIISKPDGTPISLFDLRLGEDIIIFGKIYRIHDCDAATRAYLADLGFDDLAPRDMPEDSYQKYRRSLQAGNVGDNWSKFHSKKNDTKTFAEAMQGRLVDNSGREGFMKYGKTTLNFKCVWDNTHNLYGDRLEFALAYYLSDDTIEILSLESKMKLLKRSKLPKEFASVMTLGERPKKEEFFQFEDLYIGLELEVYGRRLQLCDADGKTREFYSECGYPLGPRIVQEIPEIVAPQREIPPSTGFGSEEDSMRSVSGSLMPGPVPVKKLGENKIISFFCSLLSGGIDDVDRRFVISYYVTDCTLKIAEPPVRNSGFNGGIFLSRREVKTEAGNSMKFDDMYIGCKLKVLKHVFLLLDASGSTLKWMEDQNIPRSSYYTILDKVRPAVRNHAESGTLKALFESEERPEAPGQATQDTLRMVLARYNLISDDPGDISEHEMRTIVRGAGNLQATFVYSKFIEQIIHPTDEFK
jgi:hypothetical protein